MSQKMSGKQKVVGGFDLEKFVGGADPTEETPSATTTKPALRTTKLSSRVGQGARTAAVKPAKSQAAPLTERLQVKLTKAEMQKIKDAAGLAPLSAYARKFLKDKGLI